MVALKPPMVYGWGVGVEDDLKRASRGAPATRTTLVPGVDRPKKLANGIRRVIDAASMKRDDKGRLMPGHRGGPGRNPNSLASMVRHLTCDGEELVLHAIEIMRGERRVPDIMSQSVGNGMTELVEIERAPSIAEQQAARAWLADRGFGKAVDRIEIAPGTPEVHATSVTGLDANDAVSFFALSRKLASLGAPAAPADAVLVDAESTDSPVGEAPIGGREAFAEHVGAGAESAPLGDSGADPS